MATTDERVKILQMLQEGRLSPENAAQLLQAVDTEPARPAQVPFMSQPSRDPVEAEVLSTRRPRWLRVRVSDATTGRPRVNVRLPLSLVKIGLKVGARYSPEIEGLDMEALIQAVEAGENGLYVDVIDDDDGEHVEVFLE